MGSVRRECLDHVLILSEKHLGQLLREYVDRYFNSARPHQGIRQQIPGQAGCPRRSTERGGKVVAIPILGGIHHDYRRAA
jgi:putative transposase